MRLTSLARRSVAVTAATALLSGGLVAGLAAPAYAAGTIDSFTPTEWDNRSTVKMTVNGSGFPLPASPVSNVTLLFTPVAIDKPNEVDTFVVDADPGSTATKVTADVPLAMAPPGLYSLRVADANGANATDPAATKFKVYGFGSANATSVAAGANPSGSDVECSTISSCVSRALPGTTPLDINGSNIAIGAIVRFLVGSTPDAGLSFKQHNPNNETNKIGTQDADGVDGTGYASTSLLQGNYSTAPDANGQPGFTPGLHKLQIVNKDGLTGGATVDFAQPWFAAPSDTSKPLSPTGIGVGAKDVVVTLTGQGIRSGSKLVIESKATNTCAGVTTGPSTVSDPDGHGTFNKISAPVSMADCTADDLNARAVTVLGPDGARFTRSSVFNVVTSPTFDAITSGFEVLGQGARVGYDPEDVTITGTGFQGVLSGDASKMTKFSFGEGVTVTTVQVTSPNAAKVRIDVAEDAPTGPRTVTVTNPDGGSSTESGDFLPSGDPDPTGNPVPLTIEAGPKVSTISPSSLKSSAGGTEITITGTFDTDDTYVVKICDPAGTTTCTESPNINEGPVTDTATTLKFLVSTNGASAGPRDVLVSDTTDHGRLYCNSCMSVDTLTVSPSTAKNDGDVTLNITQADGIETVTANSTAVLVRTATVAGQGPVQLKSGTHLVPGPEGSNSATATFPLAGVVPGKYSLIVVKDPSSNSSPSWSCTGCFTVTGTPFTVTSIDRVPSDGTPGTSTSGGQGASDLKVKITGTNFVPGMEVTIPDVTVHDVVVKSGTELEFLVDIANNAVTGSKPVTVKGQDGTAPAQGSNALTFVVTAAPVPTPPTTPAALGQGAGTPGYLAANDNVPVTISIKGSDFQPGAQLSLGPDIEVTDETVTDGGTSCVILNLPPGCGPQPDTLTGKIAVSQNAAVGQRNAVVTNPDGGSSTAVNAFTVNQGPKITSVSNANGAPVLVPDGAVHKITILGSGFATPADATKVLDVLPSTGVTITNVQVVDSGKITADIKVETNAPRGARFLTVTNQNDKGFGAFTPVYVATPPAVPGSFKVVAGAGTLTASWTEPASNGAPITGYHVTLQRQGSATVVSRDLPATQRSTTFGGLVNGATYVVKVTAANAAGVSPTATATGIPGLVTSLSGTASPKVQVAGSGVTFSGRLMHGSVPVPGRTVRLTIDPYVGATVTRTATTNSSGVWAYKYYPRYHFAVRPVFAGDATYRSAIGPLLKVTVPSRVTRTSPSNGYRSSSLTTLSIKGTVLPNHAGTYVYLYRFTSAGKTLINRVKLTSTSTFTFTGKPKKGTYVFRVYIPATTGNSANYSAPFTIYRT